MAGKWARKLIYRLYREEKLGLQGRPKARRMVSEHSRQKPRAERPNQGPILGPIAAENRLKPWSEKQNQAKRINEIVFLCCFGTRGSEAQIRSPLMISCVPPCLPLSFGE